MSARRRSWPDGYGVLVLGVGVLACAPKVAPDGGEPPAAVGEATRGSAPQAQDPQGRDDVASRPDTATQGRDVASAPETATHGRDDVASAPGAATHGRDVASAPGTATHGRDDVASPPGTAALGRDDVATEPDAATQGRNAHETTAHGRGTSSDHPTGSTPSPGDTRPAPPACTRPGPRASGPLPAYHGLTEAAVRACLGPPDGIEAGVWHYRWPKGCAEEETRVTLTFARGKVTRAKAQHVHTGKHCAW